MVQDESNDVIVFTKCAGQQEPDIARWKSTLRAGATGGMRFVGSVYPNVSRGAGH